jgi:hypothetical protein
MRTGVMPLAQRAGSGHASRPCTAGEFVEPVFVLRETPAPQVADLISDFLPFDRATLERAIDQFLGQFESLAAELAHLEASTNLLPVMSAAVMTTMAYEVVILQRRVRDERANATTGDKEEGFTALPGLPNSWSWSLPET